MLPPVKTVRPASEKARDDSGEVLEDLEELEDLEDLEELEDLEDLEEASQDQREPASVNQLYQVPVLETDFILELTTIQQI